MIVIHGNALDDIPQSYVRYLERCFMDAFDQGYALAHPVPHHVITLRDAELSIFGRKNPFPRL